MIFKYEVYHIVYMYFVNDKIVYWYHVHKLTSVSYLFVQSGHISRFSDSQQYHIERSDAIEAYFLSKTGNTWNHKKQGNDLHPSVQTTSI